MGNGLSYSILNKKSMKKHLIILFFSVMILSLSCSKKTYHVTTNDNCLECKKYKVEKINEERTVYILELSSNDSIFRVLTKRYENPITINLTKKERDTICHTEIIKQGEFYLLKLDSFYRHEYEKNYVGTFDIHHYVEFNGTEIEIKPNETFYTTKNLRGLCIVYD